jgi:Flp pilus assembly pilin Flp
MTKWLWRRRATDLGADEQGQGLVEYGMILVAVTVACVAAMTGLGQKIISALYGPATNMFG